VEKKNAEPMLAHALLWRPRYDSMDNSIIQLIAIIAASSMIVTVLIGKLKTAPKQAH